MIYNLTSCRTIIAKVFSDLDLQEETHRISDMVEWIGEGMLKIGAFPSLTTKVTGKEGLPLLDIVDYQAKLPCDMHTLNQIAYSTSANGPFYPMRYATGSYSFNQGMSNSTSSEATNTKINTDLNTSLNFDYVYSVTGGYVKTNIKNGYLLISYQAIPVDSDNYPLVPNDESFKEALYWYINMKLSYPKWKNGEIRDAIYYDAKSSWNFYRKQAYAEAMMPNSDQLESIKNSWLKLIPEINANKTFFSTTGQQDIIYNQNHR